MNGTVRFCTGGIFGGVDRWVLRNHIYKWPTSKACAFKFLKIELGRQQAVQGVTAVDAEYNMQKEETREGGNLLLCYM